MISVFVPGLSELYMYMWMGYDRGIGPYRPKMTDNHAWLLSDERPAITQKGYTRKYMFYFFVQKSSLKVITAIKYCVVLPRTTNTQSTK